MCIYIGFTAQPLRFAALVACFMGATDGLSLGTGSLDPMADAVTCHFGFGHQQIGINRMNIG